MKSETLGLLTPAALFNGLALGLKLSRGCNISRWDSYRALMISKLVYETSRTSLGSFELSLGPFEFFDFLDYGVLVIDFLLLDPYVFDKLLDLGDLASSPTGAGVTEDSSL